MLDAIRERLGNFVHRTRYIRRVTHEIHRDIEFARQRRAVSESADFVDRHMPDVGSHGDRISLLQLSLGCVTVPGMFCEFGVFRGETIRVIASRTQQPVHGFDSFEGLPEKWRGRFDKGTFRVAALPQVPSNVQLHKGWFEDTIPPFKAANPGPIAFLHMDADLYSSTRTVFDLLGDRIVPGTVIQFDEFFNYPGWMQGEYKAFMEFCAARNAQVEYLGYTANDEQVAVRIAGIT